VPAAKVDANRISSPSKRAGRGEGRKQDGGDRKRKGTCVSPWGREKVALLFVEGKEPHRKWERGKRKDGQRDLGGGTEKGKRARR